MQVRILRAAIAVLDAVDRETEEKGPASPGPFRRFRSLLPTILLCTLHGWAIWLAIEGRAGLASGWPIWRHDHPLYFHSALVTRSFLKQSGTTAGYDPAFMAGYAKSVVFPASSTLPELVIFLFGGDRPEVAYKVYVLVSAALIPWLVMLAASLWRLGPGGVFLAVAFFLIYVWTDFPIAYAAFGMLPYLLAIPLGLAATGVFLRYAEHGGFVWWLGSAGSMALVMLVHFTSAMIVAPAAAAIYLVVVAGRLPFSRSRHLGVWLIPAVVLIANAFWWLPGIWLASTKGASDFAFHHSSERVSARLWQIATTEAPIERVLWIGAALGVPFLIRRGRIQAAGLLTFAAAGFFWGYLAGGSQALDFLQPGRHTFACYSALAIVAGLAIAEGLNKLRSRRRLDVVAAIGLISFGAWFFGPAVAGSIRGNVLGPWPFLSSRPSPMLLWVMSRVKRHVAPGERILYEEGGKDVPGVGDPFQGGRFSGLLPWKLGVEVIGGPYLHAALTTNFTQFGEGKLFERKDWDRAWFVRYARLYRPSAIVCWSPHALAFCRSHPDLIEVRDDGGSILIGRVRGFEGAAIEGRAEVKAEAGRLTVSGASAGIDGSVVLRYHSVPYLRADPPVALDRVFLEGDPVPFIRLRPPPGGSTIELRLPSARALGR